MRIDGNVDERNLTSRFARFLSRLRIVIERIIETDRYRSCETLWSGTVTANTVWLRTLGSSSFAPLFERGERRSVNRPLINWLNID